MNSFQFQLLTGNKCLVYSDRDKFLMSDREKGVLRSPVVSLFNVHQ